jgi:iron complex outermembrane receptor protein
VDNFSLLRDRFAFAADGSLLSIDQRWVNAGETETSGVEVSLKSSFSAMGARWTAALEGTYLLKKRSRVLPTVPFGASEIGQFSFAGDLGLRWKHNAAIGYKRGDWSATFSQLFRAGYNDQVLPGVSSGRVSPPDWKSKVDSYTTYNVGVSWTGIKGLTLTGVVKNLLDTDPPFAITYDSNFGSGSSWEPRVADPRGRAFVVTAEYRF